MKPGKVEKPSSPGTLWHNPLNKVMEKYDGRSIQASDIMLEKGINGDPVLADQCLRSWMKMHPDNWWRVDGKIRISVTHRGEDLANRKVHEKNTKKWKKVKR